MSASDFERMQADVDAIVASIMQRDAIEPAFALLVVRGLIAVLPTEDAVTLVKYPKPLDPSALIG
jgi:hypothetical protein